NRTTGTWDSGFGIWDLGFGIRGLGIRDSGFGIGRTRCRDARAGGEPARRVTLSDPLHLRDVVMREELRRCEAWRDVVQVGAGHFGHPFLEAEIERILRCRELCHGLAEVRRFHVADELIAGWERREVPQLLRNSD